MEEGPGDPVFGAQTTEEKMLAWAGTPEAMRWVWFWQASKKLSSASNTASKEKRDCYGNTDRDTKQKEKGPPCPLLSCSHHLLPLLRIL